MAGSRRPKDGFPGLGFDLHWKRHLVSDAMPPGRLGTVPEVRHPEVLGAPFF